MSKITPVLLGADLSCYSVARAFAEEYGAVSHAFGKYRVGETAHSSIVKFSKVEGLERKDVLCSTLLDFARRHEGEELYLVPCTDEYAFAVIDSAEKLCGHYFFSCPSAQLAQRLGTKEAFYKTCAQYGLPFPKTEVFYRSSPVSGLYELPFPYPIIIKPSSSADYWHTPFEGMKKVYTAQNAAEAGDIIKMIFASGYENSIILQELVPAGEDDMYVLTAYADKNSKVRAACMGHVLLGEHTPKGLGNHVAILTEHHCDITKKLTDFLESIGYRGFANFDIIKDRRDGSFKVLEINLRQGRSNYYMTASGMNLARLLAEDRRGTYGEKEAVCRESFFWHTVPKSIIYNYITDEETKKRARALAASGKSGTALFYGKDLIRSPLRAAYVFIHNMRYFGKYNIYG